MLGLWSGKGLELVLGKDRERGLDPWMEELELELQRVPWIMVLLAGQLVLVPMVVLVVETAHLLL